jgi:hypothetical protein
MAATYVTQQELKDTLGIGTLYSNTVVEEVCQASEDIIKSFLWFDKYFATYQECENDVATLYFDNPVSFWIGETVVVTNAGAKYNGSKTITALGTYYIQYAVNNATDEPKHAIQPPATVSATTHIDYATVPAVREAALMLAVDIWQARQAAGGQAASIDGFAPSPFRMGNTLLARIRGLLSGYLAPSSMVG